MISRMIAVFSAFLIISVAIAQGNRTAFVATVIGITDGDTVNVLTNDHRQIKVRLAEIDAPESGQPFGARSKKELSAILFSKSVRVEPQSIDRYGRLVARLQVGSVDASAEMVRRGAAWVFTRYSTDRSLPAIEAQARRAGIGIWALPADQRIAPWEWRGGVRASGRQILPALAPQLLQLIGTPDQGSARVCAAKRFCAQMSSCQEAIYHLRVCGQKSLDGDRDGKPCERLCG